MSHYINYFNHVLVEPPQYHRRYDYDLPQQEAGAPPPPAWQDLAKRTALTALPFLSLYRPLGTAISLSMGACRSLSHSYEIYVGASQGNWGKCASETCQAVFAIFALGAAIFSSTLGLLLTTSIDTIMSLARACQHLWNQEYLLAGEEALQTLCSIFYLAIMLTGSLEIILTAALLQAVVSFYQARKEFAAGHYLEGAAKIAMGTLRLYQCTTYISQIQRRDLLLAIQKYAALSLRAQKGKEVRHLLASPLADLSLKIEEEREVLSDAANKKYDMGSHFHGLGKGLVKGANLAFRTRVINGEAVTELDFKVNHVFRTKIQGLIEEIKGMDHKEMQEILFFAGSQAKDITIEKGVFPVGSRTIGPSCKIALAGLGTIEIGASAEYPNLYDRVIVQMDKNKTIYDFHELLSFLDLDDTCRVSTYDDMARLQIAALFHNFCPREATVFERTEEFFTLPIEELKQEMIKKSPQFQEILSTYLDKMRAQEILQRKSCLWHARSC